MVAYIRRNKIERERERRSDIEKVQKKRKKKEIFFQEFFKRFKLLSLFSF